MIDARTAISHLIKTGGDPDLAAHNAGTTTAELLTSIANDPSAAQELASQIKISAMLQAINMLRVTNALVLEKLPNLSPRDSTNFYVKLLDNIANFTTGPAPTPPDPYDTILKKLPPEVADAVDGILQQAKVLGAAASQQAAQRPKQVSNGAYLPSGALEHQP